VSGWLSVVVTVFVVAVHLVLRAFGCVEHTGLLAGMVRSQASYVLGPLYVLTHLFSVIVAPILCAATTAELAAGPK
jgi:hypothetical protein